MLVICHKLTLTASCDLDSTAGCSSPAAPLFLCRRGDLSPSPSKVASCEKCFEGQLIVLGERTASFTEPKFNGASGAFHRSWQQGDWLALSKMRDVELGVVSMAGLEQGYMFCLCKTWILACARSNLFRRWIQLVGCWLSTPVLSYSNTGKYAAK